MAEDFAPGSFDLNFDAVDNTSKRDDEWVKDEKDLYRSLSGRAGMIAHLRAVADHIEKQQSCVHAYKATPNQNAIDDFSVFDEPATSLTADFLPLARQIEAGDIVTLLNDKGHKAVGKAAYRSKEQRGWVVQVAGRPTLATDLNVVSVKKRSV